MASASGVYEPALWVGRVSPSIEHRQFSVGNIYFGFGSGLFCGGLLSGGLCTHFRVLGILFILVCLPFGLRHSTLLSQVTDLSTYPAGLVRNPIGVILSAFAGVILRCEGFGVCKDFEFGPKFQACGSCLFLSRGDVLAEGLEVPVSFVRQRGISKQDGLEGEQGSVESMDNPHGNVTIFDAAIYVGNLFVELVSSIDQGSHEGIEAVVFGEFDIFISMSCVELHSGTLGLV